MAMGSLLIGGGFAIVCVMGAIQAAWQLNPFAWIGAGVILFGGVVSFWQVAATIAAMVRPKLPTALQVALMQPTWPAALRPLVALWWLLHLTIGAIFAIAILEEKPPDVFFVVFSSLMSMAFTYAAYGFLMLAVTCFTKRPDVIMRVWGWRVYWSAVHGIIVLVAGVVRMLAG
jgi:hypothetical protein